MDLINIKMDLIDYTKGISTTDIINKNKKDIYLITNNNRYSPKEIFEELKENNLSFLYENIISSLISVKQYLIENNYKNIYLWGSKSAKTYL